MKFLGYKRPDGSVGVRNHLLILPSTGCASTIANKIASQVDGAVVAFHNQGCAQLGEDKEQTYRTLVGLGKNPNVAAVLVVGLGCEQISADKLAEDIASSGKPVDFVIALDEGGVIATVAKGVKIATNMARQISEIRREEVDVNSLTIGVKCALTDTTSGLTANPAVGYAMDLIIKNGGTVIFGETPEIIGAEHILAKRAENEEVKKKLFEIVRNTENRVKTIGVDIRGANPAPGNIKAGITTIEEKSLGAILKGGTSPIKGVLKYGEKAGGKGLFVMDGPGRTHEALTGLVASGAVILVMPTGGGSPSGSTLAPTLKVTGNPRTYEKLPEYIDVNVSSILEGVESIEEAGERVYNEILKVASGKKTKIESLGCGATAIYTLWSHV